MSWSWTIQKAAVEQEILFPSKDCYMGYIETLTRREEPYEVVRTTENPDGTLMVVMRKRYNNNFFYRKQRPTSAIILKKSWSSWKENCP